MSRHDVPDYYEVLQVSPRADSATIHSVFRHLAKRFHPDNAESGNTVRFQALLQAFEVLSNDGLRAQYDARYEQERERRWRIFDQDAAADDVVSDARVREGILGILYAARRSDAERPGVGGYQLERLLGCPEAHLKFHVWYLKERGWVQRLEDGLLAITAAGVDRLVETGAPSAAQPRRLERGPSGPKAAAV